MLTYVAYVSGFILARLRRDDRGVTAVEYGLILALIAGVIIAGLLVLGPALNTLFTNSGNCVATAGTAAPNCTGP
jgi:pilus assembly protein Flp/PilA